MIQRRLSLLAAMGLVPAALNPSLTAAAAHIELALCGPASGTVKVPTKTPSPPGSDGAMCCAKGCHSSHDRKRFKPQRTT